MSANTLLVERYKYILTQKAELNKTTFKIASFFQGAAILISTAQFNIVQQKVAGDLNPQLAREATLCLLCIGTVISFISLTLLLGGVFAWRGYKREEATITGVDAAGHGWLKIFSWYETYIAFAIICVIISYAFIVPKVIMPWLA